MVAVSTATGLVMVAGWALVLLGATLVRAMAPGLVRQRAAGVAVVLAGLLLAVVARVAV